MIDYPFFRKLHTRTLFLGHYKCSASFTIQALVETYVQRATALTKSDVNAYLARRVAPLVPHLAAPVASTAGA